MASNTIHIERWKETSMAFIRIRGSANDKDIIRPIDYSILADTRVPAEQQLRAGALVALLFGFSERTVRGVEIKRFDDIDRWTADAQIDDGDQVVYRRGVGVTPVEALVDLAFDVQQDW